MASIPPPSPGANVDALAATAMASEGLPLPPNLSGSSPGILSGSSPGILSGSSPNALAGSSPGSARSPFEARTVAPLVPAKPVAPQGSAGKIALILIMIFVPLIGLGVGAWVYYSSPPAKGPGLAPAAPAPKKK